MKIPEAVPKLMLLEGIKTEDVANDSGGLTKDGVTHIDYDAYRAKNNLPQQSVADMTDVERDTIYLTQYWLPGGCDMLPDALAFVHFQWCVNHGVVAALRCLKAAIFLRPQCGDLDGSLKGTDVNRVMGNPDVVERYLAIQTATYDRIAQANPTDAAFENGWYNRIQRTRDIIANKPLSV